ncbi:MAG TPA: hypothetical protein VGM57_12865 [Pseudolabrys sp.]
MKTHFFNTAVAIALIAAVAGSTGVNAADEKPAFTINTRWVDASVIIADDLRTFPGLFENLLPEGRRDASQFRVVADKDRKDLPKDAFEGGRKFTYERGYTQRSEIGHYVSVLRSDYTDGLGAHPNHNYDTIVWDVTAKKRISIRPFFTETADDGPTMRALAMAIRAALVTEKKARDSYIEEDNGLDAIKPKILSLGALALAPSNEANKSSGLITYFSPYSVGSYAEGSYTLFVPWTAFKDRLSPEGAALFGGERPKADAEKDNDNN